eukprot:1991100-Pyramimonas_sp.AAC.1
MGNAVLYVTLFSFAGGSLYDVLYVQALGEGGAGISSGAYVQNGKVAEGSRAANDEALQRELWELSLALTNPQHGIIPTPLDTIDDDQI